METILVINPGSTSTKIAVFQDKTPLFTESITHTPEELAPFKKVVDQLVFRRDVISRCLKEHGVSLQSLTAIVSRGGLLGPIEAGAYEVNEDMVWQLENRPLNEHASNVGAIIAFALKNTLQIPAYIYDGVTIDEMLPINKITGRPEFQRKGIGHNLNTRAAVHHYAESQGKRYADLTAIAVHLGGGTTVNLHHHGKIEDTINDEEGPFSPERSGELPLLDLIQECYAGHRDKDAMLKLVKTQGGLMAHLGTTDTRKVESLALGGDEKAKLIYDAMALNVAKNIGKIAPGVCGEVDVIILTGGIAYSQYFTDAVARRVRFIAPVIVLAGEDEMAALANGALRVLRGEESAKTFHKMEDLGL